MRKAKAKERRKNLLVIAGLTVLVLIVLALAIRPGLLIPVTDESYGSSLGRTVSGGGGSCQPLDNEDFMACVVEDDPGSGAGRTLILQRQSRGCWTASLPEAVEGKEVNGCVGIRDLLFPKEPGAGY